MHSYICSMEAMPLHRYCFNIWITITLWTRWES